MPESFTDPLALAEAVVARVGKRVVLGLPLGLGKACHLANALYALAERDPSIHLNVFTALTLEAPRPKSDLERRFFGPIYEQAFGGYPALAYAEAQQFRPAAAQRRGERVFFPGGHAHEFAQRPAELYRRQLHPRGAIPPGAGHQRHRAAGGG